MICHSLDDLFGAVDAVCDKVKASEALAVRDFIRQNCVPGTMVEKPLPRLSEEDFTRRLRFLAQLVGGGEVLPAGCASIGEHKAFKAFDAISGRLHPFLEKLPHVNFALEPEWRFGQILFSSALPTELVESQLVAERIFGTCQSLPFEEEHLIHFLLVRREECSPLWLGLHAMQTFSVERQKRQNGFDERRQMALWFEQVMSLRAAADEKQFQAEVASYLLLLPLLNRQLGGLFFPIIESFTVTSSESFAGLVAFVLAECDKEHGEPLSELEKGLRQHMVQRMILAKKAGPEKIAEMFRLMERL